MKASITYTSTLSPQLMDWLDKYADAKGLSKKAVIEAALTLYRIQEKKKQLAQMFTELNQDDEILALAEAGMGDYKEQLTQHEQ